MAASSENGRASARKSTTTYSLTRDKPGNPSALGNGLTRIQDGRASAHKTLLVAKSGDGKHNRADQLPLALEDSGDKTTLTIQSTLENRVRPTRWACPVFLFGKGKTDDAITENILD